MFALRAGQVIPVPVHDYPTRGLALFKIAGPAFDEGRLPPLGDQIDRAVETTAVRQHREPSAIADGQDFVAGLAFDRGVEEPQSTGNAPARHGKDLEALPPDRLQALGVGLCPGSRFPGERAVEVIRAGSDWPRSVRSDVALPVQTWLPPSKATTSSMPPGSARSTAQPPKPPVERWPPSRKPTTPPVSRTTGILSMSAVKTALGAPQQFLLTGVVPGEFVDEPFRAVHLLKRGDAVLIRDEKDIDLVGFRVERGAPAASP